ncbi:MAG: glycosyltransferase family 4 protein [Hyphomicrobiaceae bacterium]
MGSVSKKSDDPNRSLRVLIFMPRNMRFGPSNATSIDLCVRDLVLASRYKQSTTVVCCENETIFSDIDVVTLSREIDASRKRKISFVTDYVRSHPVDVVVVQQHLPTAAELARHLKAPVILHTHNMKTKSYSRTPLGWIHRVLRRRDYQSLAGISFVSEASKQVFERIWPDVNIARSIIANGLDFSIWQPNPVREQEIICVARAAPEKGVKEAAEALAAVLPRYPGWRGTLALSEPDKHPSYLEAIRQAIAPVSAQVDLVFSLPHSQIKKLCERAAIAVVPSKWEEPFGRTALEAHAGGCALISSMTGGLADISGDSALALPVDFVSADIASALVRLIDDRPFRTALAEAGRERCRIRLGVEAVAASADDFYERVAGLKFFSA